jgi:hypothetical protein
MVSIMTNKPATKVPAFPVVDRTNCSQRDVDLLRRKLFAMIVKSESERKAKAK